MKRFMKGLGALAVSIALSTGIVEATSASKVIDKNACDTVYTNYYFLLESDTVGYFNNNPLNKISTSNRAVFLNNSYMIKNFDPSNIGYGEVEVSPATTTKFENGVPKSYSLDDFYGAVLYASANNGAYSSRTNNYIYSHNWFSMNNGNSQYNTNSLNLSGLSVAQLKDATLSASTYMTRLSNVTTNEQNPFEIRVDRSYYGYLTGKPVTIDKYQWYMHPAMYYVQYCSPKSNPAPVETYYNVYYRPGTVDAVTNMPADARYNTNNDMRISTVTPSRVGYDFIGWTTDSRAIAADPKFAAGTLYTDRKDLTLYAVWQKKTVTPDPTPVDPVDPTDPGKPNPPTGVSDYLIPFGGVVSASGVALSVLKKKKGFKQF